MDSSTITTLLTSIKAASDMAKAIREGAAAYQKAELQYRLAGLIEALADAKMATASVQEVLVERDSEIRQLKEQMQIRSALQYDRPYYWRMDGDAKDGPFCQACYDKCQMLSRLQQLNNGYWQCKVCTNTFTDSSHKPSSPVAVSSRRSSWIHDWKR